MTVLIDTNVALDLLLNRQPHYENAVIIFSLSKNNFIKSYISASSITDIFYIAQKEQGKITAKEALKRILNGFCPATVTDSDIYHAIDLDWDDFEDCVQYIVGNNLSVDYIVTRNIKDFTSSPIKVITPEQCLQIITDI
jgi:predicted nucleic acid-binding protein